MNKGWRSPGLQAGLIALVTMAAYLPALHNGFVFDDFDLITENRIVRASDGLIRFWFTAQAADYYPLTGSLWWFEWRLWGNHAAGYHFVSILLHAINAILVWLVLRRLKIPAAWLAALIFAVHPVNAATVAWISEQKTTLSMLLYAVAILLYLEFCDNHRRNWYILSLGTFLLALLSKSAVVMLPVVLLGCVWWTRGRVRREDLLLSLPFFALSLVLGLVTIWFQQHRALAGQPVHWLGFASRLALAGQVPWFYLYKALLPVDLTVVYPKWTVDAGWISFLPGVALFGCFALAWWKRNTWGRPLIFGLGYFVVTLFPVLGFFRQGLNRFSWVSDHWQYYSIAGVIALAVGAGDWICRRLGERGRQTGVVTSLVVITVLASATWMRCGVYANDETLWRDNVAKNPSVWPYNLLGCALKQMGRYDDAIAQLQRSLQCDPDFAEGHFNLGTAFWQAGKQQEALVQWNEALRLDPIFPQAHYNLGLILARQGRTQEAIEHWEQAVRIEPGYAEAHYNLGVALEQSGKVQEAISHYKQALDSNPDYDLARKRLARLNAFQ